MASSFHTRNELFFTLINTDFLSRHQSRLITQNIDFNYVIWHGYFIIAMTGDDEPLHALTLVEFGSIFRSDILESYILQLFPGPFVF